MDINNYIFHKVSKCCFINGVLAESCEKTRSNKKRELAQLV